MLLRSLVIGAAASVLLGAALAGAPSPTPSPTPYPSPTPDAVTILRKAEQAARGNLDPPYIVYDMHEIFIHHGHQFTYDYHVWYRTSDGQALMQNFIGDRQGHHEQHFGYPFPFAPDVNILLGATPPPSPAPTQIVIPAPGTSGASAPPLIGVTAVTANRFYSVTLVGLEDYQGHPVYHLALTPLPTVSERDHPWKDLWVDTQTFESWKTHARASGTEGPMTGEIEGTAEFEPVNGYWLLAHVTGYGEGHVAFISDSGQYEYYFSGFDFPNTLPDWYFDPDLFRHH
jgi:hypothetical protein